MRKINFMLLLSMIMFSLPTCKDNTVLAKTNIITNKERIEEKDIELSEKQKETKEYSVKLIAVGDNLIHSRVIASGKKKDGTYNYDDLYKNIKSEIEWADIKVINQETMLVKDESKYSGYPCFGSPYAIGEAVINAGFNVVLHATNHTYDKSLSGIKDTLNFWKDYKDITVLGINKNEKDFKKIKIIEINNIKIAMLNYTYGLNGFKMPKDKQYLVDTLYDKKKIKSDIKKAKEKADFVIIFPHWGTEYIHEETKTQKDLAKLMAEAGADLIIGTHPHVVEPLKTIKTKDGRKVPVYYSLGNFISNQERINTMLGGMAKITIKKKGNETYLKSYEMVPLVTHIESYSKAFTVYTMKDYTEKLASKHRLRRIKGKSFSKSNLEKLYEDIVK